MTRSDLVVASNRGPATFRRRADGTVSVDRGAGGLAPSLAAALTGSGATWIASALSELETELGRARSAPLAGSSHAGVTAGHGGLGGLAGLDGLELRLLAIDDDVRTGAYEEIANGTLWFLFHGLFDRARQPAFDQGWHEAWGRYRTFNRQFASAIDEAAAKGATVLVHDYHLALVPGMLAEARRDLSIVHFTHTPFCEPEELAVLPNAVASELLLGLGAASACGFHTERWAASFSRCLEAVLGPHRETPTGSARRPLVFAAPLAPDRSHLEAVLQSPRCAGLQGELETELDGRLLLLRSDRIELSKNLIRGFLAFDELLSTRPAWRGRVLFRALAYASRETLPAYARYRSEVEALVAAINERHSAPGVAPPIELRIADDYVAAVASLRRYDVLLVNPIRDGLNLVAGEGAACNRSDGVLVLSREAGAFEQFSGACVGVHPFDVSGTAAALDEALSMSKGQRRARATELRRIATRRTPADWLAELCRAGAVAGSPTKTP